MVPETFDPSRFLTLVSGKEYLEVKWRLVWFRSENPEGHIETEMVTHGPNAKGVPSAVFRAEVQAQDVTDPETGEVRKGGRATGWGSEDAQGFGDYLEKAETKAIGRALAALGYGTQFCGDFDHGGLVDSPRTPQTASVAPPDGAKGGNEGYRSNRAPGGAQGGAQRQGGGGTNYRNVGSKDGPSMAQQRKIEATEKMLGWDDRQFDELARSVGAPSHTALQSVGQASRYIDLLLEQLPPGSR